MSATESETRWRDLAVSRSVDPAREAAEIRVKAFIDATLDLLADPEGGELTVQNVVSRSGLSLRAFYNHFEGKHELMLAAFEEGIRTSARHVQSEVDTSDDALERLHRFVSAYYRLCRSGQVRDPDRRLPGRGMGQFAYQLLFDHPEDAARAFTPLVTLLRDLLDDAAARGAIAAGRNHDELAGIILQAIMFNSFATTLVGSTTDEVAGRGELFWQLTFHGLAGSVTA